MQETPALFDMTALKKHRARADDATSDVWFLHQHACAIIQERLEEVNRNFTDPIIIGARAEEWRKDLNLNATCIEAEDTLDLEEGQSDLIIHGLSMHWANDPVGQLVQMRRALRPDGLMIAVLFGGETLSELRQSFQMAESAVLGGIRPHVSPMSDLRDMGGLLQRAGFAQPVADTSTLNISYASPLHLMHELRKMGETNALTNRQRKPLRRDVYHAMINHYQNNFGDAQGRIDARVDFVFLTGWAPDDSQQQPLRPGSATQRLADALKTEEHN